MRKPACTWHLAISGGVWLYGGATSKHADAVGYAKCCDFAQGIAAASLEDCLLP